MEDIKSDEIINTKERYEDKLIKIEEEKLSIQKELLQLEKEKVRILKEINNGIRPLIMVKKEYFSLGSTGRLWGAQMSEKEKIE